MAAGTLAGGRSGPGVDDFAGIFHAGGLAGLAWTWGSGGRTCPGGRADVPAAVAGFEFRPHGLRGFARIVAGGRAGPWADAVGATCLDPRMGGPAWRNDDA